MSEALEPTPASVPEPAGGGKKKAGKWLKGVVGAFGKKKDTEPEPAATPPAGAAATPPPADAPAPTAVASEAAAPPPPPPSAPEPAAPLVPVAPDTALAVAPPPAPPAVSAETADAATTPPSTLDDAAAGIIADARAFWKFLRRALVIGFVVAVVFAVAEISNLGRLFYWIHPVLGTMFFVLILGAVAAAIGRAVVRYIATPQALSPPVMPQKAEEVTLAQLSAQVSFIDRFLRNCEANAELDAQRAGIAAARTRVAALAQRIAQPGFAALAEARDEARALTDQEVPKLLAPLDARVDELIWREALAVGIGTAVSPNGMLDAFIVLWRNLNLISRVSRLYFGRPGLAGTLVIARDVAGSILVASYLESVAEAAGSLIGAQLGSLAGSVAGPVMEGMTNALVTVRVGCLAKDRCRAFQRWDQATKQGALKAVGAYTKKISGKLWKEILAASGLGLGKIGEKLKGGIAASGAAAKSGLAATGRAMGKLLRRKKKDGVEVEVEVEADAEPDGEAPATGDVAPA